MTDTPFDSTLDSRLNEAVVPAGFVRRLLAIASLGDDELDVRLRDVSIPVGLEERLGNVVADEALDDQLCSVEIPVSVLTGTHNIPYVRRRSQLRQWALAASLMMMVGAGVIGLLGVVVSSVRLVEPPPLALMVVAQGPLDIVSPLEPAVTILPAADDGRWQPSLVGLSDETMRLLTTFDRPQLGPAGQLAEDFGKVWNPWDNWLLMRWGALGYVPATDAALPELNVLTAPAAQGMEAPLVRGYDREFLYSRGVQPPTLTAFDPAALGLGQAVCRIRNGCVRKISWLRFSLIPAWRRLPEGSRSARPAGLRYSIGRTLPCCRSASRPGCPRNRPRTWCSRSTPLSA